MLRCSYPAAVHRPSTGVYIYLGGHHWTWGYNHSSVLVFKVRKHIHNLTLSMVVGLVGLYGFGAKTELVALCSRVLTGSDPATTEPCLVPLGILFALRALELHLGCMFASYCKSQLHGGSCPDAAAWQVFRLVRLLYSNSEHP